ncbi:4-demethylwyosine synthase TYW1 [Candidatus Hecatella orcuttiae]|jgi:tRNA wybutosine-synthesizing protein 1|uniref:4-demethylwyosine synthase TYW1 n=1 Tax=Candidatus Hecatella orcuttiae TaxID=1935119 RepID=UPI00286800A2|nr:4-demethylwyosine synthase TYW1 [Candidatus Hecatella orcuttiae]
MEKTVLEALAARMRRERYQLVGAHSAVKKCSWLHQSLVHGRVCYKQKFYGIQSHRCLQMTPVAYHCLLQCLFCWRIHPEDLGLRMRENEAALPAVDSPEFIVEESLKAQRRILSGYKAHREISPEKYREALNPAHAAISLTGEPTLYPRLGELIECFHRRGMTTFLVTSGTAPQALSRLPTEPSQLYLSLYAPEERTFIRLCRPRVPQAWQRVMEALEWARSFRCPRVLRLTLVRGRNMEDPEGYARIIAKTEPTYVEAKAYMYVGFSRRRLPYESMPSHGDVRRFAESLSALTGYRVVDEAPESRVALLSRHDGERKLR